MLSICLPSCQTQQDYGGKDQGDAADVYRLRSPAARSTRVHDQYQKQSPTIRFCMLLPFKTDFKTDYPSTRKHRVRGKISTTAGKVDSVHQPSP